MEEGVEKDERAIALPPPASVGRGIASLLRGGALIVAFPLLVVAIARLLLEPYVASRESDTEMRWAALGLPRRPLEARYPDRSTNPNALLLEGLAEELGIDLAPERDTNPSHPERKGSDRFEQLRPALRDYLERQTNVAVDILLDPPDEVKSYLSDHRRQIEKVVKLLESPEPPRWGLQVAIASAGPNLQGLVQLQRVLVAASLAEAIAHRGKDGIRILRAVDALNESVKERPEIASIITVLAVSRIHLAALRRMIDADPDEWSSRFDRSSVFEHYIVALRVNTMIVSQHVKDGMPNTKISPPLLWLSLPYFRLTRVNSEHATQSVVAGLRAWPRCGWQQAAAAELWRPAFPRWDSMSPRTWNSGPFDVSERILRIELARELTLVVLRARRGQALAESPSVACPHTRWRVQQRGADFMKMTPRPAGFIEVFLEGSPPRWQIASPTSPHQHVLSCFPGTSLCESIAVKHNPRRTR